MTASIMNQYIQHKIVARTKYDGIEVSCLSKMHTHDTVIFPIDEDTIKLLSFPSKGGSSIFCISDNCFDTKEKAYGVRNCT